MVVGWRSEEKRQGGETEPARPRSRALDKRADTKRSAQFVVGNLSILHEELELELIQTQMTQKPMLRAEVYARALRASQNRKEDSV